MEQSEVVELKRRFVRKGQLLWGIPMAAASPFILLASWAGPMGSSQILFWLFVSALTSLTAYHLGAVWAEVVWLFLKDSVLRGAHERTERKKGSRPGNRPGDGFP